MALARLVLKNLGKRVVSPSSYSLVPQSFAERSLGTAQHQRWGPDIPRGFSTPAGDDERPDGGGREREVAVSESDKKSRLFPKKKHRRGLWRRNNRDLVPALGDFLPSGLENALVRATDNINKLLENLAPSKLIGRVREQEDCYKLRYFMPGISKEDVKITVEDGILRIKAEHKEEDEQESEDEQFLAYYETVAVLPEDAKVDEIKAEMKDGVLTVIIPRTETPKKEVKEVPIH